MTGGATNTRPPLTTEYEPLPQIAMRRRFSYLHHYIILTGVQAMETDKDKLKAALLKRALGYEYDEREIIVDKDGKSTGKVRIIKRHVPPDLKAINKISAMIELGEW